MQDTKHPADQTNAASHRGRPSLRSESTLDLILMLIRARGISDSAAATRAGISPATLSRWKKEHPELALHLAAAREDFRDAKLAVIEDAKLADDRPDWRAAAWLLERTFPEDYSRHREPATLRHVGLQDLPEVTPLQQRPWQDIARELEPTQPVGAEAEDEEDDTEAEGDEANDPEDLNHEVTPDHSPAPTRPRPSSPAKHVASTPLPPPAPRSKPAQPARPNPATPPRNPLQNLQKCSGPSPLAGLWPSAR